MIGTNISHGPILIQQHKRKEIESDNNCSAESLIHYNLLGGCMEAKDDW